MISPLSSPLPLARRTILAFAALFAITAAVLTFAPARAITDDTWTVLARSGVATWRTSVGEGSWQDLQTSTRVPERSQIRTGSNGHAVVAHSLDRIEVQPNSTVMVTASVSNNGTMEIYQDSGAATYSVEKRPAGTFSVRTPYVVAIVKGTKFSVEVGESSTSVSVTEGRVSVQDRRSGATVDVLPGQRVTAEAVASGLTVTGNAAAPQAPSDVPGSSIGLDGAAPASAAGAVNGTANATTGAVSGALGGTVGTLGGTVSGLGSTVGGTVGELGDTVSGLGGTVGDTVGGAGGTVGDLGDTVGGVVGGLGGAVGSLGGAIGGDRSGGGSGGGGSGGGGSGGGGSDGGGSGGGGSGDGGDSDGGDSGGGDSGGGSSGGASSGGSSDSGSSGGSSSGGGLGGALGGARDAVGGALGGLDGALGGGGGGGGLGGGGGRGPDH